MSDDRISIKSYRRVFEVDRRLYRVDRYQLPVPNGIPLAGVGYFLAAVLVVVALSSLPVTGAVLGVLSWPLRYFGLPLVIAVLGTQATPDGRAPHRFAADWLRMRTRAPRRCAGRVVAVEGEHARWRGRVRVRWDADAPRLQRARIVGPVRVRFNQPVRLAARSRSVTARGDRGERVPKMLVVDSRVTLKIRP